ncbi:hypothetical protein SAMN05421819_3809 [Bryocella elongata]|uniref:Uncharacterized protein n=1 Tax=Bryocella elongata TaxID=863522 RepID=A0A1H6BLE7_9BACT|nr:hypothetical protein [Bryocella elongata]SEG61462.1 hypothetical protein SAMN05421819_3809 [Bryocella elongata]
MARIRWQSSETVGLKVCVVTCASVSLLFCCSRGHAQALPDAPGFLLARYDSAPSVAVPPRVEVLPDSTSASSDRDADFDPLAVVRAAGQNGETQLHGMEQKAPALPPPTGCVSFRTTAPQAPGVDPENQGDLLALPHCENPIQYIVTERSRPLSSREKGDLAIKDFIDPFNILVLTAGAGFSIAANSHSAYGPGFSGWGKLTGYSFVEDAQGEFIGTYMISSLAHEDPRYHRMPEASVRHRIGHALIHTLWTQHDDGRPMLNFETLLTYPASAELSNLYVPGVQTDAKSTARRVGIGLATDPVSNLIAEFLPDFAKRIHVRVVFMQQILNQVANGAPAVMQ